MQASTELPPRMTKKSRIAVHESDFSAAEGTRDLLTHPQANSNAENPAEAGFSG
jgi:hypothetical protein